MERKAEEKNVSVEQLIDQVNLGDKKHEDQSNKDLDNLQNPANEDQQQKKKRKRKNKKNKKKNNQNNDQINIDNVEQKDQEQNISQQNIKENSSNVNQQEEQKVSENDINNDSKNIDDNAEEQKISDLKMSDTQAQALLIKSDIQQKGFASLSVSAEGQLVKLEVETPKGIQRLPQDIVVVLDTSSSMGAKAQVKNDQGVKESQGVSYLDVLKHAVKTIIVNMEDQDRLALVSYSDQARLNFDLEDMTKENKKKATKEMESLIDSGCTNLWGGLECALEVLKQNKSCDKNQTIMILTDGEPNRSPSVGEVKALENWVETNGYCPTINSYAFGKNIDSYLLKDLAMVGNGTFSFIPCPGFIGTVFVSSMSNVLATMGRSCKLNVEALNGVKVEKVYGEYKIEEKEGKIDINLGNIQFGQRQSVILKVSYPDEFQKDTPFLNTSLEYHDFAKKHPVTGEVKNLPVPKYYDPLLQANYCRLNFIEKVSEANTLGRSGKLEEAQKIIKQMIEEFIQIKKQLEETIQQWNSDEEEYQIQKGQLGLNLINGYIGDLEKEITLGVSNSFSFTHWARHFFISINFAHLRQHCNNFCDPGVQNYGGKIFQELKEQIAESFKTIEPPVLTQTIRDQNRASYQQDYQSQTQSYAPSKQVDMGVYYDAGGGCFDGQCTLTMKNDQTEFMKNFKKGDFIKNQDGTISEVLALVKIFCPRVQLVELEGGLKITPKHPVYVDGQWQKPGKLGDAKQFQNHVVYNLVLKNGHVADVNGISCVTLGHGFKGQNVEHDYFGSEKIIKDLRQNRGYENGFIQLSMDQFSRDSITRSINGLIA